MEKTKLDTREKKIYEFIKTSNLPIRDLKLLKLAFTHGSFLKGKTSQPYNDNERLEFFGDAVLKLCISEYLMLNFPTYNEGKLSNLRAYIVSEKVLVKVASKIKLSDYIFLGKSEKSNIPDSILADALEALLAVIYYDCGYNTVKDFILKNWIEYINYADANISNENFKALFQEYTQGNNLGLPVYKTIKESGPDHKKEFEVGVYLNSTQIAIGKGKTKKDASQVAAKLALEKIQNKGSNNE